MSRQLRSLLASDHRKAIVKALERQQERAGFVPDPTRPLAWWSEFEAAGHREWLQLDLKPVPLGALGIHQQHYVGQPVVLETGGHQHLVWVRLDRSLGWRRWCRPGPNGGIALQELTTRNPRVLWADAFELQLAVALLAATRPEPCPNHTWLLDLLDRPLMQELLADAQEELTTQPVPVELTTHLDPEPVPRHAWTATELAGLRIPEGWLEPVDLAPGR